MSDDEFAVVIDNGCGTIKAGLSSEDKPKTEIPNLFGIRHSGTGLGLSYAAGKTTYLGSEAQKKRSILQLNYPMENGIITNWDQMSDIWNYIYDNELKVSAEDHSLLITEPPDMRKENRIKLAETMFDVFLVPRLLISNEAVALYASGRTSGLVLSCGEGVTFISALYDLCDLNVNQTSFISGRSITEYLISTISDRGYYFNTSSEREIVREIKEKLGFISLNLKHDLQMCEEKKEKYEKEFVLPDGEILKIGSERFRCPEALFNPSLLGSEGGGVHQLIYNSIQKAPMDTRKSLYENIVVSGGSTMFPHFVHRLKNEVQKLVEDKAFLAKIKIDAPLERKFSTWIGASRLASLSTFEERCISSETWHEVGNDCLFEKKN